MESNLVRAWFASLCKLSFTSTPVFIMTICRCLFHCLFPLALKIPVGTLLRLELFLLKRIAETGAAKRVSPTKICFFKLSTHSWSQMRTNLQTGKQILLKWLKGCVGTRHLSKSSTLLCFLPFYADIDECKDKNGGCPHECVNTQGSYLCHCRDGYVTERNGTFCRPREYQSIIYFDTLRLRAKKLVQNTNVYK